MYILSWRGFLSGDLLYRSTVDEPPGEHLPRPNSTPGTRPRPNSTLGFASTQKFSIDTTSSIRTSIADNFSADPTCETSNWISRVISYMALCGSLEILEFAVY